jgi:hypothetical protein
LDFNSEFIVHQSYKWILKHEINFENKIQKDKKRGFFIRFGGGKRIQTLYFKRFPWPVPPPDFLRLPNPLPNF